MIMGYKNIVVMVMLKVRGTLRVGPLPMEKMLMMI
jgi:hypothetical protein